LGPRSVRHPQAGNAPGDKGEAYRLIQHHATALVAQTEDVTEADLPQFLFESRPVRRSGSALSLAEPMPVPPAEP
jgi:hypothetical protein